MTFIFIVCNPACIFIRCILTDECEEFGKIKKIKKNILHGDNCVLFLFFSVCIMPGLPYGNIVYYIFHYTAKKRRILYF